MVRKLVLWKTNKDQVAEDFPAYAVHLTDFSPNRKDPLSRDMRVSSSFEQIQQLFDQLKAENITKGWNMHAQSQVAASLALPAVVSPVAAAAPTPIAVEAEPLPKKRLARKFADSETEAPAPAKTPRKRKSG